MKNAGLISVLLVGFFGFLFGAALLNGFILSYLWEWFVVPLGVRSVGVAQAIGIAILFSVLTYKQDKNDDEELSAILTRLLVSVAGKLVAFGIAYGLSFAVPA